MRALPIEFLGTNCAAPTASGAVMPRTYLDSAATTLMPRAVFETVREYLSNACANSHTTASLSGRITTEAIEGTRGRVRSLLGVRDDQTVVLAGQGATAAINRLAVGISKDEGFRQRPLIVVSPMEHHSDLLPWIRIAGPQNVRHMRLRDGMLDLDHLFDILRQEGRRVRLVAVTAASNVTGVINPVQEIARMAHVVGAEIAVDAAQAIAHMPFSVGEIDHVAFSGHKIYAPGSPGVLIARRNLFPVNEVLGDVGGGTVDYVSPTDVALRERAEDREEAGTPNIPGAVALGASLRMLERVGRERIREHEAALVDELVNGLAVIDGVTVYGPTNTVQHPRVGVVAFNVSSLPHGLVAAILSDYWNIAVRNDCFCAQPYVRAEIYDACLSENAGPCNVEGPRGMVRASFGMYSSSEDVVRLLRAIAWIRQNGEALRTHYDHDAHWNWKHRTFRSPAVFETTATVDRFLGPL